MAWASTCLENKVKSATHTLHGSMFAEHLKKGKRKEETAKAEISRN